jgi:iron complex outermembrane receptor protein
MSHTASLRIARLLSGVSPRPFAWLAVSLAIAGPAPALAAAAGSAPPEVETVIVTAELQETPLADTALTAATIEANRIQSLDEVALRAPNVVFTQFSSQESYFSIRGTLINNNAAGWDDAVATFIDDVPTTGLGDVNPDLFDLKSIEVLRGPQGTLFGRNATGGAVIIRTQPPSFTFGGKVEATYGSDNLAELRGLLTGPLSSSVAGKVAIDLTHRDDYIKNVTLHDKTDGTDRMDLRGQLLWNASPEVNVLLSADYLRDRSGGYPTRLLANFVPALFPTLSYAPDTTNQAINGFQHRDIAGLSARVTWDSSLGTFTSITGYRYVDGHFPNTVIGDPLNQLPTEGLIHDTQISQEFRLASKSEGPLTWVVGAFALQSKKRDGAPLGFHFSPLTVAGLFSGANNYEQVTDQRVTTDSYALFGEGTYAFTDVLKLTLGLRGAYERKSGRSVITYSIVNPSLVPGDASYAHDWTALTPKVTLSFQPNTHFMAYATAAKGFKSGGYDLSGSGGSTTADVNKALSTPFSTETVWNYELGEKLTGLDNRLILDIAAFDDEYHNIQTSQLVLVNNHPLQITSNGGDARVAGLELESTLVATDWLTLGLTYAYMDAHFTSGGTGFTGNRIPYAPKNQLHVSAELHFPLSADRGVVDLGVDETFHSRIFFDNGNSAPAFLQKDSKWNGLLNAHLTYSSPDGLWRISAWGKNLTNIHPIIHAADVGVLFENLAEFTGNAETVFLVKYVPLRVLGISLTRSF